MSSKHLVGCACLALPVVLALVFGAGPANAAWPHNPNENLPVCVAPGGQDLTEMVSDGAGGAILVWTYDPTMTDANVYAQHITAAGVVDPSWPANGVAVCTAVYDQLWPRLVSDGAGGAIVVWRDYRGGEESDPDIYAQRVLASGVVDPAWPPDGVGLCVVPGLQDDPAIASDGAGGAIVVWEDLRSGTDHDIYAQRVTATGDAPWPANGRALCTAAGDQRDSEIVPDGAGGAVVVWTDTRYGSSNIFAQHVTADGVVDPVWPALYGIRLTTEGSQGFPRLVGDGWGGAIVVWCDARSGPEWDIYAQHVLATGVLDPAWPGNVPVCTAPGLQEMQSLVSDGAGGAIVVWQDRRNWLLTGEDIFAHHIMASGAADPAWPVNGTAVCTASRLELRPAITSDGAGGAIVAWDDSRAPADVGQYERDIYAQRVQASGVSDTWGTNGQAVSTAGGIQEDPVIVSDGAGGAIIAWTDGRAGDYHVYAQRIARFGQRGTPEPEIVSVTDVPNDQGGKVNLAWKPSWVEGAVDHYWILRSMIHTDAQDLIATNATSARSLVDLDAGSGEALRPGSILTTVEGTTTFYWELIAEVPALDIVSGYQYGAPTTGDSTGAYNPMTYFMVVGWDNTGYWYWPSAPDSGYSVDNLAPAMPSSFAATWEAGTARLHWSASTEADFAEYRLHRGSSAGFVPGPGNLVTAQPDTGFADAAGTPQYYKLCAVDVHGNVGSYAALEPSQIAGVVELLPRAFALYGPEPNPASGAVALRFTVPRAADVRLTVHDAAGRKVCELVRGARKAGEHGVSWDGTDREGRVVPSGLYFVRLGTPEGVFTRTVVRVR